RQPRCHLLGRCERLRPHATERGEEGQPRPGERFPARAAPPPPPTAPHPRGCPPPPHRRRVERSRARSLRHLAEIASQQRGAPDGSERTLKGSGQCFLHLRLLETDAGFAHEQTCEVASLAWAERTEECL